MPEITGDKDRYEPKEDKELLEVWQHRLEAAEKKLKAKGGDMKDTAGWKGLIQFFEGKQWPLGMGGTSRQWDRITANQAKSNIDSIRPQLYFQNPKVQITLENPDIARRPVFETRPVLNPLTGETVEQPVPDPRTGQPAVRIPAGRAIATVGGRVVDAQMQVDLLQAIDNHHLDSMKVKTVMRRVINDALILPYGVDKLEWVVEFKTVPEIGADGIPTGKDTEALAKQYPRFSRVKPWQFLWDVELDEFDLEQARWCAEVKYLSKDDILLDRNLDITSKELGDPKHYIDDDTFEWNEAAKYTKEDRGRYKLYEIHDLKHNRLLVWIEGTDRFARIEDPNAYGMVEGSVYTLLGFDEVPHDSFPLSFIEQIRSKAQAYNKILSYQVNHVARFNRKYKAVEGSIQASELEKWERGEDGVTVFVKDMSLGPEPISDAALSPDSYAIADKLKREITEDLGVTAYNRAVREPGVDTAYEANLIQSGADVKVQEKRDIVREHVKTVVRKLNQILKRYADQTMAVQIAGTRGNEWVQWSAADIQGEFLEDVDIYSALPYSDQVERKQTMEFFSLTAADPYFKPIELRRRLLRTLKLPESMVYNEAEMAEIQAQQAQQQQAAAAQEAQKQASRTIRPTEGEVRRGPDMLAGIAGPARRSHQ